MIRINLMGLPRPKKGKRAGGMSMPVMEGDGPNTLMVAAIVAIVTLGLLGGWYWKLNSDRGRIERDMQAANIENQRLATVKARYEQRKKEAEGYERRVKVIEQLRAEQSGPVNLLAMIGDTVNGTDAVWLSTMQDKQNTVEVEGMALSTHAVANLMANLKRTGYFKSVEIKETYQDESFKEAQAFVFTLTLEKQRS